MKRNSVTSSSSSNVGFSPKLNDKHSSFINSGNSTSNNLLNNPIRKYFNIIQQTGSYGVELTWRIFSATRVNKKREEVSVFYFEKKWAEKLHKPRRRETVCEILRKDVQNMLAMSHTKLLAVIHPLEENNESMAFATEKIHCSLANVLGNTGRMDAQCQKDLSTIEINDLNLKHGIYQVSEALRYLNTSMQYSHNNCSPYTILISARNAWKLAGMGFAEKFAASGHTSGNLPNSWSPKLPKMAQPALDFIAPEVQLESRRSETSDMFSFGLVICCIYSGSYTSLIDSRNSISVYMERINRLPMEFKDLSQRIPEELRVPVEKMLSLDVKLRPNSQLFSLLKYFNDSVLMGLEALLSLTDLEPGRKVGVLNSLKGILKKLPSDMVYKSVFRVLISQLQFLEKEEFMVVIELLAEVVQLSSVHSFDEYLVVDIINLLNSKSSVEERIECFALIDPLLKKMREEAIKSILLPFMLDDVANTDSQTQITFFNSIKQLQGLFAQSRLMNEIMKLIELIYNQKCDDTLLLAILDYLVVCCEYAATPLDIITEKVLPFLANIKMDRPSVLMPALNIFKRLLLTRPEAISCQYIACELMQKLVPETVNQKLKISEFKALMELLHTMLDKVNKEYWKTHTNPNLRNDDALDELCKVPKIQMQEYNSQMKTSMSRDSHEFATPYKLEHNNDGAVCLMQPVITTSARSSPGSPMPFHKHNTESKINFSTNTNNNNNNNAANISLNVPISYGRRHSFGSTTMLQNADDGGVITASVCEGPFIGSSGSTAASTQAMMSNLYSSGSRRPSATFITPLNVTNNVTSSNISTSRKGSTDNLTVTPMARRSSFNALSDTVMNLFHS